MIISLTIKICQQLMEISRNSFDYDITSGASVKIYCNESCDAKSVKIPLCRLGKATLTLIWDPRGEEEKGKRGGGGASEKKIPHKFEMPGEFRNSIPTMYILYKA